MYYITADIETTGLDIYRNEPIQLAYMIHNEADQFIHEDSFCINVGYKLPDIITEITGQTQEKLARDGISRKDAVTAWRNIIKRYQPAILIGYNIINFDFPMIQNWINTNCDERFKFPPISQIIDVMIIIADMRKSKWMKLIDAANAFGIVFKAESLHEALTDVRITWELYKKIREIGL